MSRHISKGYPSQEVVNLPREYHTVPTGVGAVSTRDAVTMTYLTTPDIPTVHRLAQEAAHNGYNIGLDEFKTVEDLQYVLSISEVFVFHHSRTLVGCLILQPSMFSTSWRKHTCDLRIILSEWLEERGGYAMLLRIGQELVLQVGLLYDSAVVTVFLSSLDMYTVAREAGFLPTAVIPNMGYTTLGKHRHQKVALLYKDLAQPAQVKTSLIVIIDHMTRGPCCSLLCKPVFCLFSGKVLKGNGRILQ